MPLTITCRETTRIPIEVEGLIPERTVGKSLAEIERFPIFHGNQSLVAADLFAFAGSADDGEIHFDGPLESVHGIGHRMSSGTIRIHGAAGRHVGSEMSGGEIHANGDVGIFAGAEMRGGLIRIAGNADHLVGAGYRGAVKGMTGGTILIQGNAGNEIGQCMRRGLIVVGGNAGNVVGFNMIAGSIVVFGDCGARPGAGMRRGTIAILGSNAPTLLPSFFYSTTYEHPFLKLILRQLETWQWDTGTASPTTAVDLYHGDLVGLGKGEILVRASMQAIR